MPLEMFAIIVPLGIALIVLVVKYSGLSKVARLGSTADALAVFENDFGGEKHKGKVLLAADNRAAFIQMETPDKLGLVEAFGDRFISRLLSGADVKSITSDGESSLRIKFIDFTHPSGCYFFDNSGDLKRVGNWLANLEK